MRTSISLFLTLLASSSAAYAGAKVVGNGGNVIVCKDSSGSVSSAQLLDYFEMQQNGGRLQLNPALGNYSAMLKDLFTRWQAVAPKRMEQYSKWLDSFSSEAGIYPGIQIPPTEDTGVIGIPTGCGIQPAAFQRPDSEILPGVKRYTLSKDLWDLMSETQRAGLVLHELIYREAIQALHATSFATRYFNGYLSSATPDAETYAAVVSQLPLLWVEYGSGLLFDVGSTSAGDSGIPAFYREGVVQADGTLKGNVSTIFSNVSSRRLKMEFVSLPKNYGARINLGADFFTWSINSSEKDFSIKRLFVQQKQYSVDIVSLLSVSGVFLQDDAQPAIYSSISIRLESWHGDAQPDFLMVNPANSFYVQPDGTVIKSIVRLLRGKDDQFNDTLGPKFVTASGETWVHTPDKPGYVKK